MHGYMFKVAFENIECLVSRLGRYYYGDAMLGQSKGAPRVLVYQVSQLNVLKKTEHPSAVKLIEGC